MVRQLSWIDVGSRWWVFPALIVLVGCFVYANSLAGVFVFDDFEHILEDQRIRAPWSYRLEILRIGRPALTISLALNHALGGASPWGYHVFNIIVHVLAGLTLFGLIRRTLQLPCFQGRFEATAAGLALAVALLWVVHPLQTQSVTYVIQRAESMMGLFYLLTLYALLRGATTASWQLAWYALAVCACALGMASKEVTMTAPLVAMLYDRAYLSASWRELLRRRWGLYLALATTWVILIPAFQTAIDPDATTGFGIKQVTPLGYALTQPQVILHYLRLVVWPFPQSLDYGWPVATTWEEIVPSALVVLALLAVTAWAWRRDPRLSFVGAAFLLILAPTSSVLPIADLAMEHRMYLPLAAVLVLIVVGAYRFGMRLLLHHDVPEPRAVLYLAVVAGLSVALLGCLTIARNEDYRDEIVLWRGAAAVSPRNARVFLNLGDAVRKAGHDDEAFAAFRTAVELDPINPLSRISLAGLYYERGDLAEAEQHITEALRLDPNNTMARLNYARMLGRTRPAEAIQQLEEVLRRNPANAGAHASLAVLLERQGDPDGALRHFQEAVRLKPTAAALLVNEGLFHQRHGNHAAAVSCLRQAVLLEPKNAPYHGALALALADAGQPDAARQEYELVQRLAPDWPEATRRTAWQLATHPDPARRDAEQALHLARQASQARGDQEPNSLATLAAAYAEAGKFTEALETSQRALSLAAAKKDAELVKLLEAHRRLYTARQTVRQDQRGSER
jgi:tetratricopeptide (TPR) repeat protein